MQPPRSAGFSRLTSHTLTGWQHRLSVVQSRLKPALVRLRAHLNRRVKVPDLAITLGPVTESNCAGAIPPGGKQLELNEQTVTRLDTQRQVNSIRSAVLASLRAQRRSPNEIVRPALREKNRLSGLGGWRRPKAVLYPHLLCECARWRTKMSALHSAFLKIELASVWGIVTMIPV